MCSWLGVEAQSVRLTPYDSPSALYANLDHLYNYNRYEKSRIELGFTWVNPSETARQSPSSPLRWRLNGYAAYGFGDKALKYGGGAKLRLPGRGGVELELKAYNDYTRAASRSMEGYRMLAPDHNPGFLSSRFVGTKGGMLGFSMNVTSRWSLMASAKLNWEDYRFDGAGAQLYPCLEPDLAQPTLLHTAFTARAAWDGGLTLSATAARISIGTASGDVEARDCAADLLRVVTASGDADISTARARTLELMTTSGDITFQGEADRTEFKTVSGDVSLELSGPLSSVSGSAVSGDTDIILTDRQPADIQASSVSGDIDTFAQEGICPARIHLKSVSGDITVR